MQPALFAKHDMVVLNVAVNDEATALARCDAVCRDGLYPLNRSQVNPYAIHKVIVIDPSPLLGHNQFLGAAHAAQGVPRDTTGETRRSIRSPSVRKPT
jgi:hypothetical protein